MSINVDNLWVLKVAGIEVWITETIFSTWVIMLLLIGLAVLARIRLRKFKEVPTGVQNCIEVVVESFDNFAKERLGKNLMYIAPWYFMVFVFILSSGLTPLFVQFGIPADRVNTL